MLKPFHESIIDLINDADSAYNLGFIGKIIMMTEIPQKHVQEVLDAWKARTGNHSESSPVVASLITRLSEQPTADELCEVRGD